MSTTISTAAVVERDHIVSTFESLWKGIDEIFEGLSSSDWSRKHGPDWIFSDIPFHLAYFDRTVIALPVEHGASLAPDNRWLMQAEREIDAWNAVMFGQRPAGETVSASLDRMRVSRDEIRSAFSTLVDRDLDDPAWSPFVGMASRRMVIDTGLLHTWNHLTEMRLRLKRPTPAIDPALTKRFIGFYLGMMPATVNKSEAARPYMAVMEFPGVATWTIRVGDGQADLSEGRATNPDLNITQSPETFIAVFTKARNPMLLMLTRQMRVKGMRNMGRFQKLFPEPKPDLLLFPRPEGYDMVKIYQG